MTPGILKFAQKLLLLGALAITGALLSATIVRFAPGYGVDEHELDSRLSASSRDAIRNRLQLGKGLLSYYGAYLSGLVHGNLGTSAFLERPVAGLLKERAAFTARTVFLGGITAWSVASHPSLAKLVAGIFRNRRHRNSDCAAHRGCGFALPLSARPSLSGHRRH